MEGRRLEVLVSCQVKWSTARVCRHGCVLLAAPTTRARIWRLTSQRGSDQPISQSERERSGLGVVRMHRWTGVVMCAGVSFNRILTVRV